MSGWRPSLRTWRGSSWTEDRSCCPARGSRGPRPPRLPPLQPLQRPARLRGSLGAGSRREVDREVGAGAGRVAELRVAQAQQPDGEQRLGVRRRAEVLEASGEGEQATPPLGAGAGAARLRVAERPGGGGR